MLTSSKPVVAVCAVRTGSGKSQTTRYVAELLRTAGRRVAVLRHPMPYGDLARQAVQRFARYEDLDAHDCTIEEREEYEPHLAEGNLVFAGIDYEAILRQAETEADVILWDGEMPYGAAALAARRHGAAALVDPRPFAVGSLVDTFAAWPHVSEVLPA